jgi:PadR family transcriptional regulator, regulatory protein PadR
MRKTHALVQVAVALMEDPKGKHWGYDTARKAGVRSGVLYPILSRMLDEGWLTDGWENAGLAAAEGRPPRRYYEITSLGLARLGAVLAEASRDRRFASLNLKPGLAR